MSSIPANGNLGSAAARHQRVRRRRLPTLNRWSVMVLPALAFIGIFFLYPLATVFRWSVSSFLSTEHGFLGNYRWFFETPVNVTVLQRTFLTAVVVTAVCVLLGFPYAYLMTIVSRRWRLVLLALVLVPFWTSFMVRNFAWIILLQDNGVLNDVLGKIGLGPYELIGNVKGVTIGMSQILLPYMVLPLYAVLQGIDRRLLLAAEGLGARPRVAFLRIYLPLSLPGLLAGALLVFVLSLGFYITPALLGSPQNSLLSQLIVTQVSSLLAWGRGGAMAVVLLVATLALLWVASRATKGSVAAAYADPAEDRL